MFVLNRIDLIDHRGGCVVCMDYQEYNYDYGFMLGYFKAIAQILSDKLNVLHSMSFQSDSAYLFGFSYGARLIVEATNNLRPMQIGTIHCTPQQMNNFQ